MSSEVITLKKIEQERMGEDKKIKYKWNNLIKNV